MSIGSVRKVAFIGNHTPRQCGIATFTADVCQAVAGVGVETQVVAINDRPEGYAYPECVSFQVDQNDLQSYREAAAFLNSQKLDLVCVQHEYGIFGGHAGSHVLTLLRSLNAPIVTTLHTILQEPTESQKTVLAELSQLSERIIVMSEIGKAMLEKVSGIDPSKVSVIHHGIPSVERLDTTPFLEKLGLEGKRLILTFGLIAPDKGIENMISAMPSIVSAQPDAFYLVVGATHPNVRKQSGEAYRQSLVDLASSLGVSRHVGFVDRFVSLEDLTDYLQATSIYVTPYLKKEQITSGTLAYAFGSGNAVVSTPYWHAEELLADGRGVLVPFRDPVALADEIVKLLGDPKRLEAVQSRAYHAGLQMAWPSVGRQYVQTFEDAVTDSRSILPHFSAFPSSSGNPGQERLALNHLLTLTDDTGILQHSTYSVPNRFEGYCTDDNARLAIVGALMENEPEHAALAIWLQHKGLSFLHHAFNSEEGRMRNFMRFDRGWIENFGSEDSHGRAMWALGVLTDASSVAGIRSVARDLFMQALPVVGSFSSPRACAFAILGMEKVLAAAYCPECLLMLAALANRLNGLYKFVSDSSWKWFELGLAYDNARLPQALMAAGHLLGNDEMIANSKEALTWLTEVQTDAFGNFLPIGSNGFYTKNGVRAIYDQQPLEAAATIDACSDAYGMTGDSYWKQEAHRAYAWFHGVNSESKSLIDESTGGCKDGLMRNCVNHNQGAESTLAYISSSLAITQLELASTVRRHKGFLG